MKKISYLLTAIVSMVVLTACSHDDDGGGVEINDVEVDTIPVAVILPQYVYDEWENTIKWALKNIDKAQRLSKRKVALKLKYYDENAYRLDTLAFNFVHPRPGEDSIQAIIGPYHSDHAQTILNHAARFRMPVVMPVCTAAELQRIHARNTYAWFLTESDVTECEIMLQAVKTMGKQNVALIYSDNYYGKSFHDWFSYWTVELGLHPTGDMTVAYSSGVDLNSFFASITEDVGDEETIVCMALSNPEDFVDVYKQMVKYQDQILVDYTLRPMFTDVAQSNEVMNSPDVYEFFGVSPVGNVGYGFPQAYKQFYNAQPTNGCAQIYDALTIIAMGAAKKMASPDECLVNGRQVSYDEEPYGPGLTDYMRAIVSSDEGTQVSWTDDGLAVAFRELQAGRPIECSGATGSLKFDATSNTKITETMYMLWSAPLTNVDGVFVKQIVPITYLSTGGTGSSNSTISIWEQQKRYEQQFSDDVDVDHHLPQVKDHWAVVISPSTTWSNYRHQADAFAMYQTLRNHGYDDDHIVLIVEDNLADYESNKFPGQIFVERSTDPNNTDIFINDDVRSQAVVDYHFSDLTPDDVVDIMLGRQSERLPNVIHPDSTSNVFFFWSGHGGSYEGPLWGNENAREYFGTKRLRSMVDQMEQANMYRRLMFSIETCFSGKWGEALMGIPDVLVLTAANAIETSKADVHDNTLGVFLSNAFARTFRKEINDNNEISIRDLYLRLAKTTNGSHVSIYNENNYGSVFTNGMDDYMPE